MRVLNINIVIASDGTRTVAEAALNDPDDELFTPMAQGEGSSARERGDKADQVTGDELAIARALRCMAARLERQAHGRINHAESVKAHRAQIAEQKASAQATEPYRATMDFLARSFPLNPPHDF